MATWDAASCLDLLNRLASRPASDEITDATKYKYLTEGQSEVVADIAARCPWVLYGAPAALSTSDNKVFTFGSDPDGYAVFPMGKVGIYPSLDSIPDRPWREGWDYLSEGTQIRIPNNGTYSGTLYWRGITTPKDIASGGTNEPALFPEQARVLVVNRAVRSLAVSTNRPDLADEMDAQYDVHLPRWLLVWRTQFKNGGVLGPLVGWWDTRWSTPA